MTETVTQPVYGVLKFTDPDNSVTADERALFALPATKEFREEKLPLRDYRTDPSITKGPAGLDAHGFTVANHRSALEGDDFFADSKLEDVYFPEVEDLVRTLTGCKKVLIKNASFRRKLAVMQEDPKGYYKRGEEPFDVSVIPLEKPLGMLCYEIVSLDLADLIQSLVKRSTRRSSQREASTATIHLRACKEFFDMVERTLPKLQRNILLP